MLVSTSRLPAAACILLALLVPLGWTVSRTQGFVVTGGGGGERRIVAPPTRPSSSRRTIHKTTTTTTRRYVFERMSEDAIRALGVAQSIASRYKLSKVNLPCVLAGCVEHPDSAALQRTLRQYKITGRRLQTTLSSKYSSTIAADGGGKGWLAGFQAAAKDEDLPFDTNVQRTLRVSGKIADQMQSTTIYSHHIVLALLEYSGKPKDAAAAIDVDSKNDNEAWQTLVALNVMEDGVSARQFCDTLTANLQQDDNGKSSGRELVTGASGSAKTPTLAEVGVDLTQQATDGLVVTPKYGLVSGL
jgi:ATP-dependent Clp protease ATP-binding subunit ClpA